MDTKHRQKLPYLWIVSKQHSGSCPSQVLLKYQGEHPRGTHSSGDQGVWDCTNLASAWLPATGNERYLPKRDQAFPDADPSPGFSGCSAFLLAGPTPLFTSPFLSLCPNRGHPIWTHHLFQPLRVYAWNYPKSISAFLLKQPFLEACVLYSLS